jgi:hypothetical protein
MMGYNEPEQQAVQPQQGGQQAYYPQDDYGYQYPGDMWAGRPSNDQASQVRQALFQTGFSEMSEEESKKWFLMMQAMVERVAKIPGMDASDVDKIYRKFKFLINRANSQGCTSIMETKAQELIMLIELHFSKADIPMPGLSAVGAMITTHTNQKQDMTMRYPNQQQQAPGIMDLVRQVRGR